MAQPDRRLTDPTQSASYGEPKPHALLARFRAIASNPAFANPWEFVVLFAVGLFFLLYGLAPLFGGDQLGLVGADEPRYAQVAREMLAVHEKACNDLHATLIPRSLSVQSLHNSITCLAAGTVTPILYGEPWLEKPAL